MTDLTDADRAAIDALFAAFPIGTVWAQVADVYLAGLRAGMERAARICENHTCGSSYPLHLEGQLAACNACAAAIRAEMGE